MNDRQAAVIAAAALVAGTASVDWKQFAITVLHMEAALNADNIESLASGKLEASNLLREQQ